MYSSVSEFLGARHFSVAFVELASQSSCIIGLIVGIRHSPLPKSVVHTEAKKNASIDQVADLKSRFGANFQKVAQLRRTVI